MLLSATLATACGSGGAPDGSADGGANPNPSVVIAFASSFKGFRSWMAFDVTKEAAPGTVHPDAHLIEYLNKAPPTGSTSFPIGTILVKEPTVNGEPSTTPYFAMVKRGGGYNADGASDWEWFELQNIPGNNDDVQLVWRGVGPPAGEVYGGDPNAGCNTCHRDCGNDAVCAKSVSLAAF